MISAVDTSVLIDVFDPHAQFGDASSRALNRAITQGTIVACEVVWAETAALFDKDDAFIRAVSELRLGYSALDAEAALVVAAMWRQYRKHGGSRDRIIPDFIVGAHALLQADRLLTRDRGFYRKYFSKLAIIDPSAE